MPEEEIYIPENIAVFEALYGPGLISLGGYPAVDSLVQGFVLTAKTVLDIGSGLGGMTIYLAQTYQCHCIGLELQPWMADYATAQVPMGTTAEFLHYDDQGNIPLPDASVDLIVSKGVFTNISDKLALLQQCQRLLKQGGSVCLVDWLVPTQPQQHSAFEGRRQSHYETTASYQHSLTQAGFTEIELQDVTPEYLAYVTDYHVTLQDPKHEMQYQRIIDPTLRSQLITANIDLLDRIKQRQQFSYRISATKPAHNPLVPA